MTDSTELIRWLVALVGPAGEEHAVTTALSERVTKLGYTTETDAKGNLLVTLPGDPALECPRLDHFGLEVSSVDEIEAIVAKAKAWQQKDDRVQIIDVKARSSEGPRGQYVLTSAYIGYLLPMMVELQHLHVDLA